MQVSRGLDKIIDGQKVMINLLKCVAFDNNLIKKFQI